MCVKNQNLVYKIRKTNMVRGEFPTLGSVYILKMTSSLNIWSTLILLHLNVTYRLDGVVVRVSAPGSCGQGSKPATDTSFFSPKTSIFSYFYTFSCIYTVYLQI